MLPMVLAVVYSILSSLIVALTVVPLMAFYYSKTKHRKPSSSSRYVATLKWALSHKFIILLTAFLLFVGSIAAIYITTESKHKI